MRHKIKKALSSTFTFLFILVFYYLITTFIWWNIWKYIRPVLRHRRNPVYFIYRLTIGRWRWRPDPVKSREAMDWVRPDYRRNGLGNLRIFLFSTHVHEMSKVERWKFLSECFPMAGTYFIKSMERHLTAGRGVVCPSELPKNSYSEISNFHHYFCTWQLSSGKSEGFYDMLLMQNYPKFKKFLNEEVDSRAVVKDIYQEMVNSAKRFVLLVPRCETLDGYGEMAHLSEEYAGWHSTHHEWRDAKEEGRSFLVFPCNDGAIKGYTRSIKEGCYEDEVVDIYLFRKSPITVTGTQKRGVLANDFFSEPVEH